MYDSIAGVTGEQSAADYVSVAPTTDTINDVDNEISRAERDTGAVAVTEKV
jgi:hypothetical protein